MSEKLITRTLNVSVVLVGADGKRVTLNPGDTHQFTAAEVDQITAGNPDALSNLATIDLDAQASDPAPSKGGKSTKGAAPGPSVSTDL